MQPHVADVDERRAAQVAEVVCRAAEGDRVRFRVHQPTCLQQCGADGRVCAVSGAV